MGMNEAQVRQRNDAEDNKHNELNDKNIFIWNEMKEKKVLCNYIAHILFISFSPLVGFFFQFISSFVAICDVFHGYVNNEQH